MFLFIFSRLMQGIIVLFCIVSITFFLVRYMPGDPFTFTKDGKKLPPEVVEMHRKAYHLDQPKYIQYGYFLKDLLKGNLGYSLDTPSIRVMQILKEAFPHSLLLGIAAMAFALFIGISAGCCSALYKSELINATIMVFALLGICIPAFVLGPLLVKFIAFQSGFFRVAGWEQPRDIILPAITLGAATAAYIARLARSGMLDVLSSEYIRMAKAKGLSPWLILMKHGLKGALIPVVAFIGPAFAMLISGSFVIETIFQIPGVGQYFVSGATNRDYTMLQGLVLFFGIIIVITNFLSDIALAFLNPKLRSS